MSTDLRGRVLHVLTAVAPDADAAGLDGALNLRDQIDFDSMDTLNFAIGLKEEFSVDIPDTDFRELASLDRCVAYLQRRLG